jgi:two-component system sensor histidine kinase TctE
MGSLRRRLLAWLLAATSALGLVAMIDTWREAEKTATAVSDRVLRGAALAIAERVTVNEDTGLLVNLPYSALEMLSSTAQDRVFYRVDGPLGFITGYQALEPVQPGTGGEGYRDDEFSGEPIRILTLARTVSSGVEAIPFQVTIAESTLARRELTRAILLRSAIRLAGLILGAYLIVWVAVPLALRPLNRLGEGLGLRGSDDLSPISGVPAELAGVVEALNSFMARLGLVLGALRNFTGNASHQLRTPLAVVRTQLALGRRAAEVCRVDGAGDAPVMQRADQAVARAERILAQLLLLARVDAAGRDPVAQQLDLMALARELTSEAIPHARALGIDLGFEAGIRGHAAVGPQIGAAAAPPPVHSGAIMVRAEPVLLGEAVSNLLSNALAYAGSGAEVTVEVGCRAGNAVLAVVDDGPGIAAAEIGHLSGRFARGAAAMGVRAEGLGLGLAVVAEIAALFGGKLSLGTGPGARGLRAEIELPLAGRDATP